MNLRTFLLTAADAFILKLIALDFAQPGAYAKDNVLSQARSLRRNPV
jgi:hypothetical protein